MMTLKLSFVDNKFHVCLFQSHSLLWYWSCLQIESVGPQVLFKEQWHYRITASSSEDLLLFSLVIVNSIFSGLKMLLWASGKFGGHFHHFVCFLKHWLVLFSVFFLSMPHQYLNIIVLSILPQTHLPSLIKECQYFVLPRLYEQFVAAQTSCVHSASSSRDSSTGTGSKQTEQVNQLPPLFH